MGILDIYLHYMTVKELQRVVKLPVEIDSVTCSLSGEALIKGVHLYAPPIDIDSRWELDHIMTGTMHQLFSYNHEVCV